MKQKGYKNRINWITVLFMISICNSLYGQQGNEDSLHISILLKQEGEIKLNRNAVKSISFGNNTRSMMQHNSLLNAIVFKPAADLYKHPLLQPDFHFTYRDYSSIHLNKWKIKTFIDDDGSKSLRPKTDKSINLLISHQLNNKFSIDFFGGYVYKAFLPQLMYDKEAGTKITYKITDKIKIHTSFKLQHNKKSHEWGSGLFFGTSFNLY